MSEPRLPVPYRKVDSADQGKASSAEAEDALRKCPFCREQIYADALKCKHCGSILVPISENSPSSAFGNHGNSVQIVTKTQESSASKTNPGYSIHPPPNTNSMLGHGWSVLVVAFIFSAMAGGTAPSEAVGVVGLGAIIVAPWAVWLLSKPNANKVLPSIALILMAVVFVGVLDTSS